MCDLFHKVFSDEDMDVWKQKQRSNYSFVYIYVQSKRKSNVSSQARVVESNRMSAMSTQDFTCLSLGQSTVERQQTRSDSHLSFFSILQYNAL